MYKDWKQCALARLQNSLYFYVFKHARAVKQKLWNNAENSEPHTFEARARKALTPHFTVFFTDFEEKTDCFAVYALAGVLPGVLFFDWLVRRVARQA